MNQHLWFVQASSQFCGSVGSFLLIGALVGRYKNPNSKKSISKLLLKTLGFVCWFVCFVDVVVLYLKRPVVFPRTSHPVPSSPRSPRKVSFRDCRKELFFGLQSGSTREDSWSRAEAIEPRVLYFQATVF